jgi:hypothetical protein
MQNSWRSGLKNKVLAAFYIAVGILCAFIMVVWISMIGT